MVSSSSLLYHVNISKFPLRPVSFPLVSFLSVVFLFPFHVCSGLILFLSYHLDAFSITPISCAIYRVGSVSFIELCNSCNSCFLFTAASWRGSITPIFLTSIWISPPLIITWFNHTTPLPRHCHLLCTEDLQTFFALVPFSSFDTPVPSFSWETTRHA